jgi:putative endonuclease
MRVKDAVGRFGEEVAAQHLAAAGLQIVERNWRCREGELDIVARDHSDLVFVEVKTRSSLAFGAPVDAISPAKLARLRRLALRWLAEHRELDQFWDAVRFDVVSVLRDSVQGLQVQHLRGVL